MSTQDTIATLFLRNLGAPNTPLMRAAVKAWLIKEGISSAKRNNPWNLHQGAACGHTGSFCSRNALPGQIGVVNVGPGDQNVAVFSTLNAGVAASVANLKSGGSAYGYDKVIAYARAGDPVNFLNALALSSWSYGRYGTRGGGPNSLITIYNGLTGQHADPLSYFKIGNPIGFVGSGSQPSAGAAAGAASGLTSVVYGTTPTLDAWGGIVSLPVGHVVTQADVDKMMVALQGHGFFANDPFGQAQDATRKVLSKAIGKSWNKDLQNQIASDSFAAAIDAGGLGASVGRIADVLGKLGDPATGIRLLGLAVGVAMAAWGGVNIARATAS